MILKVNISAMLHWVYLWENLAILRQIQSDDLAYILFGQP